MDKQFEKQLLSGAFKNNKEFISNKENLLSIIKYLTTVKISPQALDVVFSLIKFYRFPIALCCSHLYKQIQKASLAQQNQFKDKLIEIAAYVRSLVLETQQKIFAEIQFFFEWGQAKKKYKINALPQEKSFMSLIGQLSNQKRELQALVKSELSAQEKKARINKFLSKTLPEMNVFEEHSIEFMKSSCVDIIAQIEKQQEVPKEKKVYKKMVRQKSADKMEVQNSESVRTDPIISNPPKEQIFVGLVQKSQQCQKMKYLCCRTYFTNSQIIQYPQSIRIQYKYYNFPFRDNQNEYPGKQQKIKRTICGFLNAQGGIIYFGIKELPESKKRVVYGIVLTERGKKEFTSTIMKLSQQVLPDVGKKCTVKYVPIRQKDHTFITGRYVVKVIIEKGAKNQVYSYVYQNYDHYNVQKFTFRTENQVLQISEIQRVLKIFKDKLESPQRDFYPTHPYPCLEPQAGKPLYDRQQFQIYENNEDRRQFPPLRPQRQQYENEDRNYPQEDQYGENNALQKFQQPGTWHEQQQLMKRKRFKQKQSYEVLINIPEEDLDIFAKREFMDYQMKIKFDGNWIYLLFEETSELKKLDILDEKMVEVYSRISYEGLQKDQILFMQEIIGQFSNKWNLIKRDSSKKILMFKASKPACQFYLRMVEMGLNVQFTPLI